jgi:hypothetical protein
MKTPRTDKFVDKLELEFEHDAYEAMVMHSRALEQELAESYKIIDKIKKERKPIQRERARGWWI